MVLDTDTLKIICQSALRPRTPNGLNERLVAAGGEEDHQPHSKHTTYMPDGETSAHSVAPTVYIKSRHDDGPTSSKPYLSSNR